MATSIVNLLLIDYYIPWTIGVVLASFLLALLLTKFKVPWVTSGLFSVSLGIIITYASFIYRSQYYHVKLYGVLQPISTIIIVLLATFLISNSLQRYSLTYSKIEFRLLLFYSTVFISWYALYLETITTIGLQKPEELFIVHFYGLLVLLSAEIAGIAIYLVAEIVFFPNYRYSHVVKTTMYFLTGFTFGAALYNSDSDVIIVAERVHQYVFSFPNPLKLYTILSLIIIFIPYMVLAYHARRARRILLEAKKSGRGRIDPIAIPRLKLAEISMYVYLVGSGAGLLATWTPMFFPDFTAPYGINFALTVPFIGGLIIILYLTFQTPVWLKQKWRKQGEENN